MSLTKFTLSVTKMTVALALATQITGCEYEIEKLTGLYEGDYSLIENSQILSKPAKVVIDEKSWKEGTGTLSITDASSGKMLTTLRVEKRDFNLFGGFRLFVKSPAFTGNNEIEMIQRGSCAEELNPETEQNVHTSICLQAGTISVFHTSADGNYRVVLYLSKNGSRSPDPFVRNGQFSLKDLYRRVLSTSYETRIAAEKLFQAQQEAKIIRSNLFPAVGLGSTVSLITYPGAVSSMVGTLVPFIFPSRWFDLARKDTLLEAEVMSYKTLVANQMSLIEELYFSINRDSQLLDKLKSLRSLILERRSVVELKVEMGDAPESDLRQYDSLLFRSANDIKILENGLNDQLTALTRGIGLSPRFVPIKKLVAPKPLELSSLKPLNPEYLWAWAKSGSLELKQVLFLEKAAGIQATAENYSYINPSDWISLNLSTIHKVQISQSAVREAQALRETTENKVEEQVLSVCAKYNQLVKHYADLKILLEQQNKNLEHATELYRNGMNSISIVREETESLIKIEEEVINVEAAIYIHTGKINRLLWTGDYLEALNLKVVRTLM